MTIFLDIVGIFFNFFVVFLDILMCPICLFTNPCGNITGI